MQLQYLINLNLYIMSESSDSETEVKPKVPNESGGNIQPAMVLPTPKINKYKKKFKKSQKKINKLSCKILELKAENKCLNELLSRFVNHFNNQNYGEGHFLNEYIKKIPPGYDSSSSSSSDSDSD